ncbi:MAG: cory-CC-star protein [Wolinella sp.]
MKLVSKFVALSKGLEEYYASSYRGVLAKSQREIDDFFMIITFSEMMGIPNPYELYTLELLPELMPKFHAWHKRVGFNESPFENFPCACC